MKLEKQTLVNRSSSPCRDDYPKNLTRLLETFLNMENPKDPVLDPLLEYDRPVCEDLCKNDFWVNQCGCSLQNSQVETLSCPTSRNENNSMLHDACFWNSSAIPSELLTGCGCYQPCTSYKMSVMSTEKIRYSVGKQTFHLKTIQRGREAIQRDGLNLPCMQNLTIFYHRSR
jgi:hypothetical protein